MTEFIKKLWSEKAKKWKTHVGELGDNNRRFNSDPILWKWLGNVKDLTVLDAGCGTGYLSIQLHKKGAKKVIGVDFSKEMIEEARQLIKDADLSIDFHVDSCSSLQTIQDNSIDVIASNYVLMDLPDLKEAAESFYRVLKCGGRAGVIIGHPCFDQHDRSKFSYYEEREVSERWGFFTTPFIFYHRPLSTYWKIFRNAGFTVKEFDEPVVTPPCPDSLDPVLFKEFRMNPYSVAFLLEKN